MLHAPDREAARFRFDLERDLHDRAAVGMSALALELGLISTDTDPGVGERVEVAQDMLRRAIDDLRGIGRTLYPPVLVSAGLGPALRGLAERRDLHIRLDLPRRDLGAEAQSRTGLLVADHLNTLHAGSAVLVRVRGRRIVRVHITDKQPGRPGLRHHRAVLTCG